MKFFFRVIGKNVIKYIVFNQMKNLKTTLKHTRLNFIVYT